MKKTTINYAQANFLKSAAKITQLPEDNGKEVAFVGRSNAGKSSALNAITQQKQLAKVSKTPGRTQLINVFLLGNNDKRLIDLPGYGYAKVSAEIKKAWDVLLQAYLIERQSLSGLILLMDCRHPLNSTDEHMIHWANQSQVPIHILLTKSDKLAFGAAKNTYLKVKRSLSTKPNTSVQLFSAKTRVGLDEVYQCLDDWLQDS